MFFEVFLRITMVEEGVSRSHLAKPTSRANYTNLPLREATKHLSNPQTKHIPIKSHQVTFLIQVVDFKIPPEIRRKDQGA